MSPEFKFQLSEDTLRIMDANCPTLMERAIKVKEGLKCLKQDNMGIMVSPEKVEVTILYTD